MNESNTFKSSKKLTRELSNHDYPQSDSCYVQEKAFDSISPLYCKRVLYLMKMSYFCNWRSVETLPNLVNYLGLSSCLKSSIILALSMADIKSGFVCWIRYRKLKSLLFVVNSFEQRTVSDIFFLLALASSLALDIREFIREFLYLIPRQYLASNESWIVRERCWMCRFSLEIHTAEGDDKGYQETQIIPSQGLVLRRLES